MMLQINGHSTVLPSSGVAALFLAGLSVLVTACSTPPQPFDEQMVQASLVGLEQVQDSTDILLYVRPEAPTLKDYGQFIVEPVMVTYTDRSMMGLAHQDVARIKQYLQEVVIAELETHGYGVVTEPAPNVLVVQLRLIGLAQGSPLLGAVLGAGNVGVDIGSVTVEADCHHSLSNRLDAVVVARRQGSGTEARGASLNKWRDVEAALDEWAEEFRMTLDKAHGKS
jgi:hypothetical protein